MMDMNASTEVLWESPTGTRTTIIAGVGMPHQGERCWLCPVAITGLHERLPAIVGEDSLQALSLALSLIHRRLRHLLEDGGRLLFPGTNDDFPLDAYFPAYRGSQRTE